MSKNLVPQWRIQIFFWGDRFQQDFFKFFFKMGWLGWGIRRIFDALLSGNKAPGGFKDLVLWNKILPKSKFEVNFSVQSYTSLTRDYPAYLQIIYHYAYYLKDTFLGTEFRNPKCRLLNPCGYVYVRKKVVMSTCFNNAPVCPKNEESKGTMKLPPQARRFSQIILRLRFR